MLNYNAPTTTASGTRSDIDAAGTAGQMQTFFWLKKAIITARKEQYFMPLSSTVNMPKHYGKTIKVYEYVPLLDDRNINDMGIDAAGAVITNGNLYGSSKDIGTITSKLPVLTENGGRVNRVGFTRIQREGSLQKLGFFTEFTQEALNFDSDDELMDHLSTELMNGAVEISEDMLQRDLLNNAGVVVYAGIATSHATVTGEGATPSVVDYQDLMRLDALLTDNRTPKQTKIITGSRMIDTKVISGGRVLYVGSEIVPLLKSVKDLFNNQAFIPIQQYGDAGTIMNGEIGSIDAFRIIQVPEMLHWAGQGATAGGSPTYRNTSGKYNVYPLLCVGDDSFVTIGFETDGKTVKFSVMTKMPGKETADRNDPYGETGFSSIKWYYGFLTKRPERIGVIKSVAPI
jgi:N4-gp56 family major capsid protein